MTCQYGRVESMTRSNVPLDVHTLVKHTHDADATRNPDEEYHVARMFEPEIPQSYLVDLACDARHLCQTQEAIAERKKVVVGLLLSECCYRVRIDIVEVEIGVIGEFIPRHSASSLSHPR
jgi:hypothetical protein